MTILEAHEMTRGQYNDHVDRMTALDNRVAELRATLDRINKSRVLEDEDKESVTGLEDVISELSWTADKLREAVGEYEDRYQP